MSTTSKSGSSSNPFSRFDGNPSLVGKNRLHETPGMTYVAAPHQEPAFPLTQKDRDPSETLMQDLYRRLKGVGFDREFLRSVILPDSWQDGLAANAATFQQILLRIARRLSLPFSALTAAGAPLALQAPANIRLKRARPGTSKSEIAPGMIAARNTVALLLPELANLPDFVPGLDVVRLRESILRSGKLVDFSSLVEACWSHGIAVLHFRPLPEACKKFAGMAYFEGDRPVIVLASGYDAPPRLAFYLAHEIGHILRGHVVPGGDMIVDGEASDGNEDIQEREADEDALILLTGKRNPGFTTIPGLTAQKLADAAQDFQRANNVHAGTVALVYGKTANRMPVAASALKLLNMDQGARAVAADALRLRLPPPDELPDPACEVLKVFGL